MNIDVNKIINGTPFKRITNGYNIMKENYTKETANEYYDIYSKESLSDILENSKLIFSEPYRGLDFYKGIVLEASSCIFTRLKDELSKVSDFMTESEGKISDTQKAIYTKFYDDFKSYVESVSDIILVSSYIKERENESFERDLSNIIYTEKASHDGSNNVLDYMTENADLKILLVYAPFIYEDVDATGRLNRLIEESVSKDLDESNWSTYIYNAVIMNRLNECDFYKESVNENIHNMITKSIFKGLMESDIESNLNNIRTTSDKDENLVFHESSHDAITNLYLEKYEKELFKDEIKEEKERINSIMKETYDTVLDLLTFEYQNSDDKPCNGYSFVTEGSNLESAYLEISSKLASINDENFFEKSEDEEDDFDKELNSISKEVNDDKEDNSSESNASTSSHIKAPKSGNIANRIQTKAQDNNVKTLAKAGKLKKVGQDVANAAKAVAKLPIAFIQGLKNEIHKLDTMDDERRKAYITAPGYRKSIIKKLHLALLYGGAASVNLALIPVVMTYRHFSKIKDKRMRNEAIHDLEAEIKVCDAKIEDAQQSDDKKEKYQLIRIREKLNTELIRVTTNSKYV